MRPIRQIREIHRISNFLETRWALTRVETLIQWWCYVHVLIKSSSKTEAPNSTTHDHYVLHMVHFASHIFNIFPLVLDCHIQILTSSGKVLWNLNSKTCKPLGFRIWWGMETFGLRSGKLRANTWKMNLASIAINCWQFVNFSLYGNTGSAYSRIKPEVAPTIMKTFWLSSWTLVRVTKLI